MQVGQQMAAFCRIPRDSSRAGVLRLSDSSTAPERLGSRGEVGHAIGRRDEVEMLPDGQGIEKSRIVRHEGQLLLGRDRIFDDVMSADRKPSGGWLEDSGHGRRVVVFPAPLGPSIPRIDPAETSKDRSWTARVAP